MKALVLLWCLMCSLPVYAGDHQWTEIYLQGVQEIDNTVDNKTLVISCPIKGSASPELNYGIALIDDTGRRYPTFTISLLGKTYSGPIQADRPDTMQQLSVLLIDSHADDISVTVNNQVIRFPKNGANHIPNPLDKEFDCQHQ